MKILILALALSLSACGKIDQLEAHYTGYSKLCVDGVTYIQFTSGATVQRNAKDQLVPCK